LAIRGQKEINELKLILDIRETFDVWNYRSEISILSWGKGVVISV